MFLYGSAYPIGKIGTDQIPPLFMGSLRVFFVFLFIFPFFKFSIPKKQFFNLFVFSFVMGFLTYACLYLALDFSSLISPIIIGAQLSVPFGLLLSKFMLGEEISKKKWFFIFTAFVGIFIVAYDPRFVEEIYGIIAIIMMSFFYGLANNLSRHLKEVDTVTQLGWHSIIGFIFLMFFSFVVEGNPIHNLYQLNFLSFLAALHAGLFVSLIGHGGLFYLYKFYPVATVLPYYSLFPLFGIVLTFIIFFEIPGIYEIIGGIIVISSVYLIHLGNKKDN